MAHPEVPQRPLGRLGLVVAQQGLGCWGMSAGYTTGDVTEADKLATIHRALKLGVTLLDTADVYGPFTNEELVGKAIKGQREKYTIATKCGIVVKAGQMTRDGSRQHIRDSCEASLRRLGIDCIDLYYLHRPDPNTPVTESFAEMKALVEEGKVKYVGISEASPDEIRAAHAVCLLSAVQLEWSLWTRDHEAAVIPLCRQLGIGIVAYSPLGRGFLTGAIQQEADLEAGDWRLNNPRFQAEAIQENLALVHKVEQLAQVKGCSTAQLALAWVHAQGEDVFPIPGTKRIKYLEENVGALGVALSVEDCRALEEAVAADKVVGGRY